MTAILATLAGVLTFGGAVGAPNDILPRRPDATVAWGEPQTVDRGDYPRLRVLADGRYALVFSQRCAERKSGQPALKALMRTSADCGRTWGPAQTVLEPLAVDAPGGELLTVGMVNSELTQLSAKHPHHPGRLIYSVNLRPDRNRSSVHPFSIGCAVSDDGGRTWGPLQIPFRSQTWTNDVLRGCWEPYVQELPDGTLHMYYSDETPYWSRGSRDQNISYLVSTDGGDTWSGPKVAAYTEGGRDGMPVTTIVGDRLYLAIEAHHADHLKWPMRQRIVSTKVSAPWAEPVLAHSPFRYDPIIPPLGEDVYCGAPYLVQTENFLLLSGQCAKRMPGKKRPLLDQTTFPVWVMRKDEIGTKGELQAFRNPSKPLGETAPVRWSSLASLGGDEVMAVLQCGGRAFDGSIVLVRGKVGAAAN